MAPTKAASSSKHERQPHSFPNNQQFYQFKQKNHLDTTTPRQVKLLRESFKFRSRFISSKIHLMWHRKCTKFVNGRLYWAMSPEIIQYVDEYWLEMKSDVEKNFLN